MSSEHLQILTTKAVIKKPSKVKPNSPQNNDDLSNLTNGFKSKNYTFVGTPVESS